MWQRALHDTFRTGRHWKEGVALITAASAAYAVERYQKSEARCHSVEESVHRVALDGRETRLQRFRSWLQARGCDVDAIDIRPVKETPHAGLGVYVTEDEGADKLRPSLWRQLFGWMRGQQDIVVASFPLRNVVSAKTLLSDEHSGMYYRSMLERGFDERDVIMLFLMVERAKGAQSEWHPWISILPASFDTPLVYGDVELVELAGTPLEKATHALRQRLREKWRLLAPEASRLLQAAKAAGGHAGLTFEDLLWAHCAFWSRSIAFPDPADESPSSQAAAEPREGIVPGLDCCNHSSQAVARWSVWNRANTKGSAPTSVALIAPRKARLKPEEEVFISYGDKSNEELLLGYGFTVDGNSDDALMLRCPAPDESDASLAAKLELMTSRGLRPQLFLTAAQLESSMKGDAGLHLSQEAWELLEVLTIPPETAIAAAENLRRVDKKQLKRTCLQLTGLDPVQQAERRLAKLSLLLSMLQEELQELEQGTGSLELDVTILEAEDLGLPARKRSCVVYRASLKRLARSFLKATEAEVASEESRLQRLGARQA